MRNIKLTIAYDGADFHGWQNQPGMATIQGAIGDAARTIAQENIVIHGASRTDAGVHALAQVAHFKTQSVLAALEFQRALNALLPPAIRIVAAEEVGPDFHSRWLAQAKTYRYRIHRGRVLPPFEHRRALHYPGPLDEQAMASAARQFEGEHDFTSFAASSGSEDEDRERDSVRLIYSSEIICEPEREEIVYVVRGRSFLRYMVRKIVGTLIEVGKGRLAPADISSLFELRDRSRCGPTVPPEGLYLVAIEYPDPTDSLAFFARTRGARARASRRA
ncbi:MAG: tRNA pseudouridine(38-40) synthase TruA [Candidatus Acidiferrales bacterium]